MSSKYKKEWEEGRSWLKPVFGNNKQGRCIFCNCNVCVSGGLGQVKYHEQTPKHRGASSSVSTQRTFSTGTSPVSSNPPNFRLNFSEQVLHAEILHFM